MVVLWSNQELKWNSNNFRLSQLWEWLTGWWMHQRNRPLTSWTGQIEFDRCCWSKPFSTRIALQAWTWSYWTWSIIAVSSSNILFIESLIASITWRPVDLDRTGSPGEWSLIWMTNQSLNKWMTACDSMNTCWPNQSRMVVVVATYPPGKPPITGWLLIITGLVLLPFSFQQQHQQQITWSRRILLVNMISERI